MTLARDTNKVGNQRRAAPDEQGALALMELGRGQGHHHHNDRAEQKPSAIKRSNGHEHSTIIRRYRRRALHWRPEPILSEFTIIPEDGDENSEQRSTRPRPASVPSSRNLPTVVELEFRNYRQEFPLGTMNDHSVGVVKKKSAWVGTPLGCPPRLPLVSPLQMANKPLASFSMAMKPAPALPPPPAQLRKIDVSELRHENAP